MDMKIGLLALCIVRSLATRYSTYYTILYYSDIQGFKLPG